MNPIEKRNSPSIGESEPDISDLQAHLQTEPVPQLVTNYGVNIEPIANTTLEKRRLLLIEEISRHFPLPPPDNVRHTSRVGIEGKVDKHFFYSNDFSYRNKETHPSNPCGYSRFLRTLSETEPKKETHQLCATLVVGESSALSSLVEFARHSHLLLLLDYDHCQLHARIKELELFNMCREFQDSGLFSKELNEFITEKLLGIKVRSPEGSEKFEKLELEYYANLLMLKSKHVFSSIERFSSTKKSLTCLPVAAIYCNLFNSQNMSNLESVLKRYDCSLKVLNLTNVMEYTEFFYPINDFSFVGGKPSTSKFVKTLPISSNALCFCSSARLKPRQSFCLPPKYLWDKIDELNCERFKREHGCGSSVFCDCILARLMLIDSNDFVYSEKRIKTLLASGTPEEIKGLSEYRKDIPWIVDDSLIDEKKKSDIKNWFEATFSNRLDALPLPEPEPESEPESEGDV